VSPTLQKFAETAIRDTLNYPGDPSAAMVVLDTKTGAIRAMASSEDYKDSQFNRAAQAKRQPGSTAKIWVLASFMKAQVDPDSTTYTSRPFKVRYLGSTEWWEPKTYDGSYGGTRTIRSATVASDNSVYAQMTLDMGPETVAKTAHQLGITSPLENVWSIGLGSQVVTPLEQTNFYSTIARGGIRRDPTAVEKVTTPGGNELDQNRPAPKRVLKDWQAMKIVDILHDNVIGGTGTGAYIPGQDMAGKTGTTDDHKDAWFCGMTPELTACVWMGYNIPTPMYSVHGISVAGGTFPATIWRRFMEPALQLVPQHSWFTVKGTESWLPFTSTWQDNPSFEVAVGADPSAVKEDDKDSKKDDKVAGNDQDPSAVVAPPPAAVTTPPAPTPPPAVTPPPAPTAAVPTP
jgi:penicillin-binding protein 1A